MKLIALLLVVASISFQSCYFDIDEEINPLTDCIVTEVSYAEHLLPVLKSKCYSCHGLNQTQSDTLLEPYSELVIQALRPYFMLCLRWEAGYLPMPPNEAKLDDCTLRMFQAWIDQGAPDN